MLQKLAELLQSSLLGKKMGGANANYFRFRVRDIIR